MFNKQQLIDKKEYFKKLENSLPQKDLRKVQLRSTRINRLVKDLRISCNSKKRTMKNSTSAKVSKRINFNNNPKLSNLHQKEINQWFRTRYADRVSLNYLYYPEEIEKRLALIAIFRNFDVDGDGQLDINEFLSMFIQTYINEDYNRNEEENYVNSSTAKLVPEENKIKGEFFFEVKKNLKTQFQNFYHFITKNDYLSLEEFIQLCLNKEAINYFMKIMKELNEEIENEGKETLRFIPFSFDKMVKFLGMESNRKKDFNKFLNTRNDDLIQAFEILMGLFVKETKKEEREKNKMRRDEYRKRRKLLLEETLNPKKEIDYYKKKKLTDFKSIVKLKGIAAHTREIVNKNAMHHKIDSMIKSSRKDIRKNLKKNINMLNKGLKRRKKNYGVFYSISSNKSNFNLSQRDISERYKTNPIMLSERTRASEMTPNSNRNVRRKNFKLSNDKLYKSIRNFKKYPEEDLSIGIKQELVSLKRLKNDGIVLSQYHMI